MSEQRYLFSYDFRGDRYSLEVVADSPAAAQAKVAAMSRATLDGEVAFSLHVPFSPQGFLARLFGGRP